jgi:hypothetical protein
MSCVWLTNRRKWSWRFFIVTRLYMRTVLVYGLASQAKQDRKPANTARTDARWGLFGPRFLPLPRLQDPLRVVPCGLWQRRGSCVSVGGSHFTPTSCPFHPQRRAQAAASAHRITASRPHRHTRRERDWTVRTRSDRRDGMARWLEY